MKCSASKILILTLNFISLEAFTIPKQTHKTNHLQSSIDENDFMASLRSRIEEVSDRETKLALVVLDSMLPRQVLKIEVKNPLFKELIHDRLSKENPYFGMMGMARRSSGEIVYLKSGVEVEISDTPEVTTDGGVRLELKAGRRFKLDGDVENAKEGWTEARVQFLNAEEEQENDITQDRMSVARAMIKAKELTTPNMSLKDGQTLIQRWIQLAKENEKESGQIDTLLTQLGEIPPSEEPTERAFWVGALINPIPALGVAMEIRPSLLTAVSTEERIQIAIDGVFRSIRHMEGTERMW